MKSASTLPDCSGTSPARRSSRTRCGQRTRADDDPFQAVRQVLQRCGAEDSRAANVNAQPNVVPARDGAASRLAWRSNRHRPAPPSPRAPDEPSAALEWSLDRTPSSIRRRRPHRPAQPAVPSREGTPTGHDQHRRPARNPPSVDGPSLRLVCFLRRWSLNRPGFNFRQFSRLVDTVSSGSSSVSPVGRIQNVAADSYPGGIVSVPATRGLVPMPVSVRPAHL